MHLCCICMPLFILFPPPLLLSVDPETAAAPEDYFTPDDQYHPAELPGKQPPLIIPISPIPFSLILALDVATVIVLSVAPILMHSLFL